MANLLERYNPVLVDESEGTDDNSNLSFEENEDSILIGELIKANENRGQELTVSSEAGFKDVVVSLGIGAIIGAILAIIAGILKNIFGSKDSSASEASLERHNKMVESYKRYFKLLDKINNLSSKEQRDLDNRKEQAIEKVLETFRRSVGGTSIPLWPKLHHILSVEPGSDKQIIALFEQNDFIYKDRKGVLSKLREITMFLESLGSKISFGSVSSIEKDIEGFSEEINKMSEKLKNEFIVSRELSGKKTENFSSIFVEINKYISNLQKESFSQPKSYEDIWGEGYSRKSFIGYLSSDKKIDVDAPKDSVVEKTIKKIKDDLESAFKERKKEELPLIVSTGLSEEENERLAIQIRTKERALVQSCLVLIRGIDEMVKTQNRLIKLAGALEKLRLRCLEKSSKAIEDFWDEHNQRVNKALRRKEEDINSS